MASAPLSDEVLIAFDPRRLGLFGDYPPGSNRARRKYRAAEVLAKTGAAAVLDGSMYEPASPPRATPGDRGAQMLYDRRAGLNVPGDWAGGVGSTLIVKQGRASFVRGKVRPEGADLAIQLYPTFVYEGVEVHNEGADEGDRWRAAAGVMRDGQVFFAVGRGGTENFARWLQAQGVWGGALTDGGGSASLLVRGNDRLGDDEDRAISNWLVAYGGDLAPRARGWGWVALGAALGAAATLGVATWRNPQRRGRRGG